jgi:hypothetical protein
MTGKTNKSNTKEFIEKAKEKHGEKYDYSKVVYDKARLPVDIICPLPEHGEFKQSPNKHLAGQNCPKCAKLAKKSNTKEFIEKAKEKHGEKYDYSKVVYFDSTTPVSITCKKQKHGEFEQTPSSHLQGHGCTKCAHKDTEDFKSKAKEIHGERYDYSKVVYDKAKDEVIIICQTHGQFEQCPGSHLQGHGCPECGILMQVLARTCTTEEFKNKAKEIHGDRYDYSKVDYKNNKLPVVIICCTDGHGEFEQAPANHLFREQGCAKCYGNKKSNTEEFKNKAKEIHGESYDYSEVDYLGCAIKVSIICKKQKHGKFEQTPSNHLNGNGCPKCMNKTEGKVSEFLLQILDEEDIKYQYSPDWAVNKNGGRVRYDFYIRRINAIFEIDGRQHFEEGHKWYDEQHTKDTEKVILANENGIFVVRLAQEDIWSDSIDWKKIIQAVVDEGITENNFFSNDANKYTLHKKMLTEST